MKRIFCYLALCAASVSLQAQNPGPKLYGVTFFGNELISVSPSTGAAEIVGPLDAAAVSGYGLAARYGRLYSFDPNTDRIVEIGPGTGQVRRRINVGLPNLTGEGDITFRGDGVGFLTSALAPDGSPSNDLYTFDVIAGTSARLGGTGVPIDALAFSSEGVLYALGQGDGVLYTLNQTTGAATEVGSLGVAQNSPFAALTFSPDGLLYAVIDDRLYVVNTATGAASTLNADVLDLGFSSVSGLAFQAPDDVPQLFGLSFYHNELFTVGTAPDDGYGQLVGITSTPVTGYGLAGYDGRLYTFDPANDRIREINPANGSVGRSFALGLTGILEDILGGGINLGARDLTGEGDIAIREDGVGFIASALAPNLTEARDLIRFNLATSTSSRVGTTDVVLDGLAFAPDGSLYALGQGEGMLYTVNQTNAAVTAVGSLGVAQNSPFAALTFGPDGTLYAAIDDRLYTVNTSTGAATPLNPDALDLGFASVSGLAFAPRPADLALVREGNAVVLYWPGGENYTLESATTLNGVWTPALQQQNPQRLVGLTAQSYYRLRR